MPPERSTLDRLWTVAVRLSDENEGTRTAAATGFARMCQSENIDLRDYQIVPLNGHAVEPELEARWSEYRRAMREAYPAEAKAHDEIDRLRAENAKLKRDNRELAAQVRGQDADELPWKPVRDALQAVAGADYLAPMSKPKLRETVEAAGWHYQDFLHAIGYRNQTEVPTVTVTPWIRVVARTLSGPPPSRKKKS